MSAAEHWGACVPLCCGGCAPVREGMLIDAQQLTALLRR